MATIVTDILCDLTQPVKVQYLHGNLFSQDNAANTINVHVHSAGVPESLGGTISANVIRSDGGTVAVAGSVSGDTATVVLPQACYAVPGVIHIIIKSTVSSVVTTIAALVANVYTSSTDTVVDPGTIITDVAALIAEIEEAVDSIPVDYSGLLATIAADYSSSKTYQVGQYAWQGGVLKRCIVPITTAETYTAAHWTNAVIGDDLSALKSALSESENGKRYISGVFSYGVFNSSNMPESDPRKFNAVMMTAEKYNRDIIITAKTGYNFLTYWYNDSDVYVGKSSSWETSRIIPSNTNFRLWVRPNPLDTSIILDLNTVKESIIFNTKINDDVEKNTNDIATEKQNLYAVADGIIYIDTVFVYGKMNTSTGAVIPDTTKYQVVMPNYVTATKDITIDCNTGYRYQVWWYTDQDVYISRTARFKVAGEKYTVSAGTNFRLFVTLDPPNIQAVVPVDTFAKNVFMQTGIQSQIKAIREKPLTTLPTYILNNTAEKPLGSLSKGYILLSFDDGAKTLATGTIPLLIENEVPGTFGLLPESAIFASGNESELATVVDAVENHGCVVAMHGSAQWPTYTESALNAYFDSTIALFNDNDLGDTYGAICPGGNGADTSALVKAVAGGKFGYVFSGNRVGKISYDSANADGKYNGARSNRFDLDRISGIGITTAKVQAIVNYAAENHLLLCPFWHDNTLNNENHPEYITYFNALISAAKDAGLTFITTKDLPNIT